MKTYILVCYMW